MRYFITGGTGSLGNALVDRMISDGIPQAHITVYSRGESKQSAMAKKYPKINYVIGDVRDFEALRVAMRAHTDLFHLAAMKHIDLCEKNPDEAVKTNLIGTMNAANLADELGYNYAVLSSTDKAVLPINLYGTLKASCEHLWDRPHSECRYVTFRWGNVMASNGSVIPFFSKLLLADQTLPITDERMTRFWIPLEEAASFMYSRYDSMPYRRIRIPSMGAAKLLRVVDILADIHGVRVDYKVTGLRAKEKIHECIVTGHDYCLNSNDADIQLDDQELRKMIKGALC